MRALAIRLVALLVRPASDAQLERWFGLAAIQRAMFAAMVIGFRPGAAQGFQGRLVYELTRPETGRPPLRWTLEVTGRRAAARRGASGDPALTLRLRLSDFVRVATGLVDPAMPLLQDRGSVQGDLGLAARLPEMFGAPRPR